ncbi:MAG TPA: 16S rRNA (cytidine(1402)-2'-O)-methyltransferase [Candidatus Woesebacteria bacterium]|nr:16S rRNA (cytidine(1402)-2'-O)-methyltransferase [Candidatus Woesebacteria bacterium]
MLYLITTPIGNLNDISQRAIEVLEKVDILLCEDTRSNLLDLLGIKNKPIRESFYDEVEERKIPQIIKWLREGKIIGLITKAGTPLISDPGWRLVKQCQKLGLKYTAIPGPCAAINALVLSGLPPSRFSFLGFLPKRSADRMKILSNYKEIEGVKIVYESPYRIQRLIGEIKAIYGDNAEIIVCREMTKKFEEIIHVGTCQGRNPGAFPENAKGEITVVFKGVSV